MSSRNTVPAPAVTIAASAPIDSRSRAGVRLETVPNSRLSMSAGPAVPQSMATRGERGRVRAWSNSAISFGRHPGSAITSTGVRRPGREVERVARRRRGVRDTEQRQRRLGAARPGHDDG